MGVKATFNNISVISWRSVYNDGEDRSTWRKPEYRIPGETTDYP